MSSPVPVLIASGLVVLLGFSGCIGTSESGDRDGATATAAEELVRDWRWKHRVLLVWSDRESDLRSQADLVRRRWKDWCERDLLLVLTEPQGGVIVERFVDGGPVGPSLRPTLALAICDRQGIEEANRGVFAAALIGKDGGVKHRYDGVVDPDEIFSRIDAMPMRMREMRDDS